MIWIAAAILPLKLFPAMTLSLLSARVIPNLLPDAVFFVRVLLSDESSLIPLMVLPFAVFPLRVFPLELRRTIPLPFPDDGLPAAPLLFPGLTAAAIPAMAMTRSTNAEKVIIVISCLEAKDFTPVISDPAFQNAQ